MIEKVCEQMCDTCIFRPGNLMRLREGRLEQMVAETDANDSNVICHKSQSVSGEWDHDALCRGSVDRRPGQLARIMGRLGLVKAGGEA